MDAIPREIFICQTDDGGEPFIEWLDALELKIRGIIRNRIDRVENGNLGDAASVGGGVTELRIDVGSGFRVYFGQVGNEVHLISGDTKRTQSKDIVSAKEF